MKSSPRNRDQRIRSHPPLRCWFCDAPSVLRSVIDGGILVSRSPESGGPYYLYTCPYCLNDWMCEETPAGRWFASPTVRIGLLDYLLAHMGDSGDDSASVLKAISWYRENEDRRRYFFERDGDHRYSNTSILARLWPWARSEEAADRGPRATETDGGREPRGGPGAQPGRGAEGARKGEGAGTRSQAKAEAGRRSRPRRPRLLSPHEILGVAREASREEIERRFYRLAVQYHPDKVHHMGGEFRAEAHRRFVELQRAYRELLRRQR